jgi:hypothetical protein
MLESNETQVELASMEATLDGFLEELITNPTHVKNIKALSLRNKALGVGTIAAMLERQDICLVVIDTLEILSEPTWIEVLPYLTHEQNEQEIQSLKLELEGDNDDS